MQSFTLWMGVNLVSILRDLTGLPLLIKWPNDVLCNGRKVAGMLTEARVDNDRLKDLIFGLGININAPAFEGELKEKATSLFVESGRRQSLHRLTIEVLQRLLLAYGRIEEDDISSDLRKQWDAFDCLKDQVVTLNNGVQTISGIARGIDPDGALCLKLDSGKIYKARAGDVSLSSTYTRSP
jgi:BirA family biotin operon repressor/biotin-[acetyl-CoA-carboxylase] ligase